MLIDNAHQNQHRPSLVSNEYDRGALVFILVHTTAERVDRDSILQHDFEGNFDRVLYDPIAEVLKEIA